MNETRYLPAAQFPVTAEAGGAIVPMVSASIAEYAQDVYLSLPKERQNKQNCAELAALADRGDWSGLEVIRSYFTSNSSVSVADNSTHSQVDRHDSHSYEDNRAVVYSDDRQWHDHQLSYQDDRSWTDNSADYQLSYQDDRSWVDNSADYQLSYRDDRSWVDNSSYAYAPEQNYYIDNSIYVSVDVDGSFNGNGNSSQSSSSSSSSSTGSGGSSEFDPIKFVLFIFSVGLAAILAAGIWQNASVNLPARYAPVEVR